LNAVPKEEAKPLQYAESQSRVAEHQGPDFVPGKEDGFGRSLAYGGGQEAVRFAQQRGPTTKGSSFPKDSNDDRSFAGSQIHGSLKRHLTFRNDVKTVSGLSLAKDHLTRPEGFFPAKGSDFFNVFLLEAPEEL